MSDLGDTARLLADLEVNIDDVPGDGLARGVLAYQGAIEPYLEAEANQSQALLEKELSSFSAEAKESGWLMTGAYYWTIAGLTRKANQTLYQSVVFSGGEAKAMEGEVLSDFEPVLARYERYMDEAYSQARALGLRGAPAAFPSLEWLNDKISGALGRYGLDRLTSHLAQGDPVAAMASLGHFLIGAAETVIGLKVLTMALAQGGQNSSSSVLGQVISAISGSVSSFLTGLAGGTVTALGPYLTALSLLLLGYGFFLAYFLPAVPLIFWLSGVLSWLMATLESLVAAPLWLTAHALPEGDGLAGRAAGRGYLLFLGVLLRPPLMVLGFLMAMALLTILGRLSGQAMTILGDEVFKNSFLGISGFLALTAILGAATVTATYKLFGLTAHLPERVMGWIGQGGQGMGEANDAQMTKANYAAANLAGVGVVKLTASPGSNVAKSKPGQHI
jgi:conjugal transfer/type IV secretion protein DotA/TraY